MRVRGAPPVLVTMIALALAASACGSDAPPRTQPTTTDTSPAPSPTTPLPTGTGATTPPVGGATAVEVIDNEYRPREITVSIGTQVIWTHRGTAAHSVTADNAAFDSHPDCGTDLSACLKPGETFPFTFTQAGRFAYHCKVHGVLMSGAVVVQ